MDCDLTISQQNVLKHANFTSKWDFVLNENAYTKKSTFYWEFQRFLIFKLFIALRHNYIRYKKTKQFSCRVLIEWIKLNFPSRLSLLLFTLGMFSSSVGTCGCHSGRLVQPHQRNCSRNSVFSRVSIVFVSGPVSSFVCITLQKWTIWSHVFWPHCSDKSSTSNMKIDTLSFLGCILAQHPPKVFHPHIHVLFPVSVNLRCLFF